MNYSKTNLKEGITFHKITTNKFKTNMFSIFITTPITRANVTKNALISAVLRRGTGSLNTQELIAKKLENMYGASFDCGVEKTGDNHVLKFYLESVNDSFLPDDNNIAEDSLKLLFDIVFNPYLENGVFKKEYVEGEKNTLKTIIEGKIDNKARYALDRCIEETYKDMPYGLYKFGYVEDLKFIDEKNLYDYYKELISNSKIDVFASGYNIDNLNENKILDNLPARKAYYNTVKNNVIKSKNNEPKIIKEEMDVTQGKLMMGIDLVDMDKQDQYKASVYNTILGGGANSKLFQNVREKANLCYVAGSSYFRAKNGIFVRSGIEIKNYDKAVKIIKEQFNQMLNGDFTDEDIINAKELIYASLKSIPDSQDGEIIYYFSQELSDEFVSIEEYKSNIEKVNKQDIIDVAKKVSINTIYFLTGKNK